MLHRPQVTIEQSQVHSSSAVINALMQKEAHTKKTKSSLKEWAKPHNYSVRLNDVIWWAYWMDSATYFISIVSESANEFITTGVPVLFNGALCILPALIPFLPNLIYLCCLKSEKEVFELESEKLEALVKELDEQFFQINVVVEKLTDSENKENLKKEIVIAKEKRILRYFQYQKKKYEDHIKGDCLTKFDDVVNTVYLFARAVGGVIMVLKAWEYQQNDETPQLDETGLWIARISTAIYMIYYLTVKFLPQKFMDYCEGKQKIKNENSSDIQRIGSYENLNDSPSFFRRQTLSPSASDVSVQSLHEPFLATTTLSVNQSS